MSDKTYELWVRAVVKAESISVAHSTVSDSLRYSELVRFTISPPGSPTREITDHEEGD